MKTNTYKTYLGIALLGSLAAFAPVAQAQIPPSVTTTTSAGTIQDFSPDSMTVTTQSSPEPVHFTSSKTTTYVDENGNPVSVQTIRSGAPVTVFYDTNGDQKVVTKVVVRKSVDADGSAAQTTTTTTSTAGTVNSFGDNTISIKSDPTSTPVNYSFTKTTTYVDENGNPVSVDTVRSGAPVTVYYDREGDQMVATRVMVRKSTLVNPDGSVIEHKKTTTTTTTESNQ
jgi:hypothetical protein